MTQKEGAQNLEQAQRIRAWCEGRFRDRTGYQLHDAVARKLERDLLAALEKGHSPRLLTRAVENLLAERKSMRFLPWVIEETCHGKVMCMHGWNLKVLDEKHILECGCSRCMEHLKYRHMEVA